MDPEAFGITGATLAIICVSTLCALVLAAAGIAIPIMWMRKKRQQAENLAASGTRGEAAILSLEDTGLRVNDNPRVTILLEIRMPNMSPYQLRKTMVIPLIRMSQVQVGTVVPVMVDLSDAANPDKVGLLLK